MEITKIAELPFSLSLVSKPNLFIALCFYRNGKYFLRETPFVHWTEFILNLLYPRHLGGGALVCSLICLSELNVKRPVAFGQVAKWSILICIVASIMNTLMEFHTF